MAISAVPARAGFVPLGPANVSISYETAGGIQTFSDDRAFTGTGPTDATVLAGAPNIKVFNSQNSFGWRTQVPGAQYPGESVLTTSFFKADNDVDYFPGILENSNVTVTVSGIQFSSPAEIDVSTFMMHTLWDADQVDLIEFPYVHVHNFHTATDPFRDFDAFVNAGVFTDFPHQGYALADFTPQFTGQGTTTLGFTVSIPYDLLKHLDEMHNHHGNEVPPGLPAPHGFLEPFHLHIEYIVAPEPSSLTLLAVTAGAIARRRRR